MRLGQGGLGALLGLALAVPGWPAEKAAFVFVDVAAAAGVVAPTWCGREDKPHIMESNGTGLAWLDYDGDGDLDLYLANGWRLEGARVVERGRDVLYRNEADGRFVDVTDRAGLGCDGWGSGVATGDVDGDGLVDLFVTNFGPDVLYHNSGDGTFEEVPGGPSVDGWSTGAVLFDGDGDGDGDVFIGAYIACTLEEVLEEEPRLDWEGLKVMLGPFGLEGEANAYFENLGGLAFRERTVEAGLADAGLFYTFAVAALDLDGDRDLDLYAANDSNPNYLYQNDGAGVFQEVGLWSGAALDAGGNAQAGMGLAAGDMENDGWVDLVVMNFQQDVSTIYRNLGDLIFEDVTRQTELGGPTFARLSWGGSLSDFDHDGDLDLFVANGHIYPQADLVAEKTGGGFAQANLMLRNEGGRFADVSSQAGPGLEVLEVSHGLAVGDFDFDGDLDMAISNVDAPPTVLRNDTPDLGSWVIIDAPGALRADLKTADGELVRHLVIGASFMSAHDPRFHFGLGRAAAVERLELLWPDGGHRALVEIPLDRVVVIPR